MSDFLSIAAVTETLRQLLDDAARVDVDGAVATAVRLTSAGGAGALPDVGINLFLYQAGYHPNWRGMDLPTRRGDSSLVQRPRAAMNLFYLLTFHGSDTLLQPQRLLGSAIRLLHARPILTRARIERAVASVPELTGCDLGTAEDAIRLTPTPLSLEDLSKLWSVFFQMPYVLSLAYQASVVVIDAEDTPAPALPVRERFVRAVPGGRPRITRLLSGPAPDAGATPEPLAGVGQWLVLEGVHLRGEETMVMVGDVEIVPDEISAHRIALHLAEPPFLPGSLRAGVHGIQVIHWQTSGEPPTRRQFATSNIAVFGLSPSFDPPVVNQLDSELVEGVLHVTARMTLTVHPQAGVNQRMQIMLNELNPPPGRPARAYSVAAAAVPAAPGDESAAQVEAVVRAAQGQYLIRLQVDGVPSQLQTPAPPAAPVYSSPVVNL